MPVDRPDMAPEPDMPVPTEVPSPMQGPQAPGFGMLVAVWTVSELQDPCERTSADFVYEL